MVNCDVCGGLTTWDEGTGYTSDEFRTIVRKGFEPAPSVILRGPSAVQGWKNGLVANSTTGWLLCPPCAARASRYMPKRSGIGPAGHVLYETMTVDKYLGIDLQEPDEPGSMDVQAPVPIQTSPASSAETCYSTKKTCPTCKKEIEARAVSCQYCNAEFEITIKGYCSTERAVVDADEKGLCLQCGKEVLDEKIESRMTTPGELPGLTPLEETESASVTDEAPASIKKTDAPAETFKKCPMCAEKIPLRAVTCEFCGAQFKVTRAGYCQNCHTVRESDENGCCIRCGTAVVDTQIRSEYIKPDSPLIPPSIQDNTPPIQTVQSKKKRSGRVLLWLGMSLILIGACFVAFQYVQPAVSVFLATETPRPTFTPRPTSTSTATPTLKPTRTATPAPVEVTFDDVSSYQEGRLVIMSGQLVIFSGTYCDTKCGLLLAENLNSSHKITIFVDVAEPDIEPVPNQMKALPDPYGQWDIRVRLNDGTYAFIGQRITVTGRICSTTGGETCISDIFKIELAQ